MIRPHSVIMSTVIGFLGTGDANNDFLAMRINTGQIEYCVTPNGAAANNPTILNTEIYDGEEDLYPVALFIDADSSVSVYRIGLNEYKTATTTANDNIDTPTLGATSPPAQATGKTNHSLQFESATLATFLGFNNVNQPPNLTPLSAANSGSFEAQNEFKITASSDNYIIEFESYPLNSHDGLDSKTRSILATVPEDDTSTNVVQYTPPYPIYVSFRNKITGKRIHNLRLRILDKDLTPVSTVGLSTMTLIMKSDEEIEFQ